MATDLLVELTHELGLTLTHLGSGKTEQLAQEQLAKIFTMAPALFVYKDEHLQQEHLNEESLEMLRDLRDNVPALEVDSLSESVSLEPSQVSKIRQSWTFANNIRTIERMSVHSAQLRSLWKKDPLEFAAALWPLLQQNLCATQITLLFRDLVPAQSESDKDGLGLSCAHGHIRPDIRLPKESEAKLYEELKEESSDLLKVLEYNPENGNLVMSVRLDKSPVLIMAKGALFNRLREAIISGLMTGSQSHCVYTGVVNEGPQRKAH